MMNFSKITEHLLLRKCRTAQIPLCKLNCSLNNSSYNSYLRRWIHVQDQKLQHARERAEKRRKLRERDKPQPLQLLNDYQTNYIRSSEHINNQYPLKYLTTNEYKRISPELLDILQEHSGKKSVIGWTEALRSRERAQVYQMAGNDDDDAYRDGMQTTDGKSEYERMLESNTPILAQYLREVMENNYTTNQLYNINFYPGNDVIEEALNAQSMRNSLEFLNPEKVTLLLSKLRSLGSLKSDELQFLANFLLNAAELNVDHLKYYLRRINAGHVLTPTIIEYLEKLVNEVGTHLTPAQKQLLLQALAKMKRVKIKRPTLVRKTVELRRPTDLIKQQKIKRLTLESIGRSSYMGRDTLISVASLASMGKTKGVVLDDDEQIHHILRHTNYEDEDLSDRIPRPPGKGRKISGYIEPWDTTVPWKDLQHYFQRTLETRASQLNLNRFPFVRGLEKYEQEFRRAKIENELLAAKKIAKATMELPRRLRKSVTLKLPTKIMQPEERDSLRSSKRKSLAGPRRLSRRLPSFMVPAPQQIHRKSLLSHSTSKQSNL